MKRWLHFLVGCEAGEVLHEGQVKIAQKKNNDGLPLRGTWRVYECITCKKPFIKYGDVERRLENRRTQKNRRDFVAMD